MQKKLHLILRDAQMEELRKALKDGKTIYIWDEKHTKAIVLTFKTKRITGCLAEKKP